MPKKYKQKSLLTKPTSSAHSNLSLSRTATSDNVSAKKTVNDLIRESRRGAGHASLQTIQSTSSVPPSLRAVLDMPAPPPPPPRLGIRGLVRLRRIPGPPPPRSWLTDSVHAPSEFRDVPWSKAHERSRIQQQSSILPGGNFPSSKSFQHAIMKSMATNWSWHAEYDHEYLAELPVGIKQVLMSYLAVFNEEPGPNPIRLLFPDGLDHDDLDEVQRLDFGNAIGIWSSLKKIERELEGDRAPTIKRDEVIPSSTSEVPDTWDEIEEADSARLPMPVFVGSSKFRNLKHLSLAVTPGTNGNLASWAALLTLTNKLTTLSSLSLAYWPQPTYTPNASTTVARVESSISRPATTYGGTNFYTAYDSDWREAAGILRSLSRSLYCLRWLDLTGCGSWFTALTWQPPEDGNDIVNTSTGPDWNGSWRGLEQLILAVGWKPAPLRLEEDLKALAIGPSKFVPSTPDNDMSSLTSDFLAQIPLARSGPSSNSQNLQVEAWDVEVEREKYYHRKEVEKHTEIKNSARKVARQIRAIRKENGNRWIDIDIDTNEDA